MNTVSENHSTRGFQWLVLGVIFLFLVGCVGSRPHRYCLTTYDRYEDGICYSYTEGGKPYPRIDPGRDSAARCLRDDHRYEDGICYAGSGDVYQGFPTMRFVAFAYYRYCANGYLYKPSKDRCYDRSNLDSYAHSYDPHSVCADGYRYHSGVCRNFSEPPYVSDEAEQPIIIQQTIIQETTVQPARPPSQPIRPPSQPAKPPAPAAKPPAESSRETPKPSKPEREESRPNDTRKPTTEPARGVGPSQAIRKR